MKHGWVVAIVIVFASGLSWMAGYIAGVKAGAERGEQVGYHKAQQDADLSALTREEELARQRLLHHPEERIGGGYRNGKFVYLKDVK